MLLALFYDGKDILDVTEASRGSYHPEYPSVIISSIAKEIVFYEKHLSHGRLYVLSVGAGGVSIPTELWSILSSKTVVLYNAQEL